MNGLVTETAERDLMSDLELRSQETDDPSQNYGCCTDLIEFFQLARQF